MPLCRSRLEPRCVAERIAWVAPHSAPSASSARNLRRRPHNRRRHRRQRLVAAGPTRRRPWCRAETPSYGSPRGPAARNRRDAAARDSELRRQATRDALSLNMFPEVTTASYVNVRHILVETEEEANQIIASLNAGESFALLAQSHSLDTSSGQRGGELGWAPAAYFVWPFGNAVETGEIGVTLAPVQTDFGWHVIQVRGREDRPVDATTANQVRQGLFSRWLTSSREAADTAGTITINDNWANYLPQ